MKLVYFILICSIIGCNDFDANNILGRYQIDKYIFNSSNSKFADYNYQSIINLKTDSIFEFTINDSVVFSGNWSIKEKYSDQQMDLEFLNNDKRIIGELRGTIIYFSNTKKFFPEEYSRVLFVKLNK